MKVIYGIGKVNQIFSNAVLAIGVFDGLHLGHQKLIKYAVDSAKMRNGQAIVMTFAPHPVKVLKPEIYMPYIVSLRHRIQLIEELGVAACIVVHFTKRFAKMSPQKFIKNYLVNRINPREVIVGEEFRFGQDRSGTIELFTEAGKEYGFDVNPLQSVKGSAGKIGSTAIRKLISAGQLSKARKHLGRYVSILGKVRKGDGRGKRLGFPTANIVLNEEVLPPLGVYATYTVIGNRRYKSMANIGHRPSFKKKYSPITLEVHIFNFKKSIYGQEVLVEFVKKIRNERIFADKEQFIQQLHKDAIKSKAILDV